MSLASVVPARHRIQNGVRRLHHAIAIDQRDARQRELILEHRAAGALMHELQERRRFFRRLVEHDVPDVEQPQPAADCSPGSSRGNPGTGAAWRRDSRRATRCRSPRSDCPGTRSTGQMRNEPGGPACSRNSITSSRADIGVVRRHVADHRLHHPAAHRPQLEQQQQRARARSPTSAARADDTRATRAPARRARAARRAPDRRPAPRTPRPPAARADRGRALSAACRYAPRHASRPSTPIRNISASADRGADQQTRQRARLRRWPRGAPSSIADQPHAEAERGRELEQQDHHHRHAELVEQRQMIVEEAVERRVASERDQQRESRRARARTRAARRPRAAPDSASTTAIMPT